MKMQKEERKKEYVSGKLDEDKLHQATNTYQAAEILQEWQKLH